MANSKSHDVWPLLVGRDGAAIVLFALFPALQVFATRAAPAAVAIALICAFVMHLFIKREAYEPLVARGLHKRPANIALVVALLWWLISLLWSPDLRFALRDIGGIVLLCAAVIYLPTQLARTSLISISMLILFGATACSIVLISEVLGFTRLHSVFSSSARTFDLNRNALLLVLMLPAIGMIMMRGGLVAILAGLTAALCVIAVFVSESQSAQLALIVAVLILPVAAVLPIAGRLAGVGFAALIICMPLITTSLDNAQMNSSLSNLPAAHGEHRIALWAGYNKVIKKRPIFGWGAGSARYMGTTGQATEIAVERGYPKWTTNPHNAPLEIWAEQGAIGAVLVSILLCLIGVGIDKRPKRVRVPLTCIFAAATTFSFVSSSLYQGWWLSSLGIGIVSCIAISHSNAGTEREN